MNKSCKNCIHSVRLPIEGDYLCNKKGVVTEEFSCRKFKQSNENKLKNSNFTCFNCANFTATEEGNSIGLCNIFSVRPFDGKNKKVCSKYTSSLSLP